MELREKFKDKCLNCMRDFDSRIEMCPFCGHERGTPPSFPFHLTEGTVVAGRYLIGTVEGSGGFSVIYRAWDTSLDRVVAIKEYFQTRLMTRAPGETNVIVFSKGQKEFRKEIDNFISEARTVSKFVSAPNIVDVYDYFEENNTAYMVMELLDGVSLQEYIKKSGGKLTGEEAVGMIMPVLDALETIHKSKYIHRDISPKNIYLCKRGDSTIIKLIDFGAACFFDNSGKKKYPIILTPGYAPPEQYSETGDQGPWTDLYALSATLYRCVTGKFPPESELRTKKDELVPPIQLNPEVPEYLNSIIIRGLSLEISLRFRNTKQFREALENRKEVRSAEKVLKARKKRRIVSVLCGALVAAAVYGACIFIFYRQSNDILDDAEISVWVSVPEYESKDQAKARFEAMTSGFSDRYSNIKIKAEYIPEGEYDKKLVSALESGKDIPTIFDTSRIDISKYKDSLSDISGTVKDTVSRSQGDYYFLDKYQEYFPDGRQAPLGFNVPVIYINNKDSGKEGEEAPGLDPEKLSGNVLYYFDQQINMLAMKDKTPDSKKGFRVFFEENKDELSGKDITEKYSAFSSASGYDYFFADTKVYFGVSEGMKGKLSISPVENKKLYGSFDGLMSLSSKASSSQKKAAQALISSLMGEASEKSMNYNSNSDGTRYGFYTLPLHKKAFDECTDVLNMPKISEEIKSIRLTGQDTGRLYSDSLAFNRYINGKASEE